MFCPDCGFNNQQGTVFCQNCGTKLLKDESAFETELLCEPQKTTEPQKKSSKKKIVIAVVSVVTVLTLIVATIVAVTVWSFKNFTRCSMCGNFVRDYEVNGVGAISTGDGTVRMGGSSLVCESCAPGYGGEGFTFHTHIGLEESGYDEDENSRWYEWENEYVEVEVTTYAFDDAYEMSEEEKDNYLTECIVDVYGDDFFESAADDDICGYIAYIHCEEGQTVICTRGYDQIYLFTIYSFSDDDGYLDALEGSIMGADIY